MSKAEMKYTQLVLKFYRKHIDLTTTPSMTKTTTMTSMTDTDVCQSQESNRGSSRYRNQFEPDYIVEHSNEDGNRSYFVRLKNGNIESSKYNLIIISNLAY